MLSIGQTASFSKTISECDVYGFAGITGDYNPVHINAIEAKNSIFGKQVVHGMMVGSLFSTILGTILPGPGTIYLEQNLKFLRPVFFHDTITATATVKEIINPEKGIYKLETKAYNQDAICVIDGYAVVLYRR
jgi:3-hydroxybutyryl-CoA dehydratase